MTSRGSDCVKACLDGSGGGLKSMGSRRSAGGGAGAVALPG